MMNYITIGDHGLSDEMLRQMTTHTNGPSTITFRPAPTTPTITKVIFNDPATIVIWSDGVKTVVKCGEDDIFDHEKGLALAISKRFFNNKSNYYNVFKKWVPEQLENNIDEGIHRNYTCLNSLIRYNTIALRNIEKLMQRRDTESYDEEDDDDRW